MRILLKCPTRSRPQKIISTLSAYIGLANDKGNIGVAISCDADDTSMTRNLVTEELHRILTPVAWRRIFFGQSKCKIEACNSDMESVDYPWDIVVLVSDDMIPKVYGWDDVIRTHMMSRFPDTDGILWFNDGYQGDDLNTLCIYGRKMYERLGHIYQPEYKSLFCDTELTDMCRGDLKDKCLYVPYCIIRHEHPGTGYETSADMLYAQNQRFWTQDFTTYVSRKKYDYDWSILIPTMSGREQKLHGLLTSIREKVNRIAPLLRLDICIDYDNRESSVGTKRQRLLKRAQGKYLSFIDDDDDITDAYIEDLREMMAGNFHTMRLRGAITGGFEFVHTTEMTASQPMATSGDHPIFQRPPNHLNPMLSDIAKLIPFKNATVGEDMDWAVALARTGILKSEYRTEGRTHYIYNIRGPLDRSILTRQQHMTYDDMLRAVFTSAEKQPPPPTKGGSLRLTARGFVSK